MRLLALILALSPFHHVAPAQPENVSTITVVGAEDATVQDRQDCVSADVGYMYLGDDGMVGFSHASCEAAFQDWRHNPPPKVWLYRA